MEEIKNIEEAKSVENTLTPEQEAGKAILDNIGIEEQLSDQEVIIKLLSIPDEQFEIIGPAIIENFINELNTEEGRVRFLKNIFDQDLTLEEYYSLLESTIKEINDTEELSNAKKKFLIIILDSIHSILVDVEKYLSTHIQIPVEIMNEDVKVPSYATLGSAGMDIYALEDYTIEPGETKIIPTGLKMAIPDGYAFLIHPRSGLSYKSKLRICNSIGLIDSDYKDEIKVIIENVDCKIRDLELSESGRVKAVTYGSPCYIGKGERFAQLRLVQAPQAFFTIVDSVKEFGEDRGGGLGSTDEKND